MKLYGETMLIGIDLRELAGTTPGRMPWSVWAEDYGALWPNYIGALDHPSLRLMAIHPTEESISVGYGVRAEYFFKHYPNMSYTQFKGRVARELTRALKTKIIGDDVDYYPVQFVFDLEEEVVLLETEVG